MPSAAAASSPGHPPRAGVLGAAGVPLSFSTAVAPPLKGPGREGVRTCFEEILNTALTARWIEQSLERAGERTRAVRARALWAADARHRLEILESVRAGACLVRRGERATVRPPGLFGAIRLSSYERDGPVCSLRGDALDEVGFTAPLRDLLKGRKVARFEPARGGAAIALLSDAGARVRVELSGEPLVNSRIVHARGCARVEWRAFQRVESNPPLAPRECEPLKPPDK